MAAALAWPTSLSLSYFTSFHGLNDQTIYVLGSDGNLWLEHSVNLISPGAPGTFGQVPPPREHVDGNVAAFQPLDPNTVYVLGSDGNLWLEHSIGGKFGQVPPPRDTGTGNVDDVAESALAPVRQ